MAAFSCRSFKKRDFLHSLSLKKRKCLVYSLLGRGTVLFPLPLKKRECLVPSPSGRGLG
jgi:hypothetical protein